jgi:hypothetical protein
LMIISLRNKQDNEPKDKKADSSPRDGKCESKYESTIIIGRFIRNI